MEQIFTAELSGADSAGVLRQVEQKIYFWSLQAYNITYDEPPSINVSIHQKQLDFLITEVFESVNNLNPQYLWD